MDSGLDARFTPFQEWMQQGGLGKEAIEAFRHYYAELARGATGLIPESSIEPVTALPDAERLDAFAETGRSALARAALLKLNGGLGTGMGLEQAKSLLVAKGGLTFLDILAKQTLSLRARSGCAIPLVLMNGFSTHEDTLRALSAYPELDAGLPLAFLQNRVPKVLRDGLLPPQSGPNDELNWAPPGHGDLYVALQTSGLLNTFLDRGIEYVFASNSDNLGAVLDERILGYFASEKLPFLMEVADRTEADRKGGHLARRPQDGRLILRESAQTAAQDRDAFQNIDLHRYFNTNNIWIHLPSLRRELTASGAVLKLPLIRNEKTLDPRDPASPAVYQLETAMGSAIEVFHGAGALRVPRTRFAPVKTTADLLVVRSDAYVLTDDFRVVLNPDNRHGIPVVSLDPRYYRFVDQLEDHFPFGPPSLTLCETLMVEGDITFGQGVKVVDFTRVLAPDGGHRSVPDGTKITGDVVV